MSRSNPIRPELNKDLQRWQNQSESKIPPGSPHPRIHELPGLAAENEAAAPPTAGEELPVIVPDDEVTHHGNEPSTRREDALDKTVALENLENDGGPTDGGISAVESEPTTAGQTN